MHLNVFTLPSHGRSSVNLSDDNKVFVGTLRWEYRYELFPLLNNLPKISEMQYMPLLCQNKIIMKNRAIDSAFPRQRCKCALFELTQ